MKNSTENQNKKRSAAGAEALKKIESIRLIFDLLHLAKTCTKNVPRGNILDPRRFEASPSGNGVEKHFLHKNRDNSHDLMSS